MLMAHRPLLIDIRKEKINTGSNKASRHRAVIGALGGILELSISEAAGRGCMPQSHPPALKIRRKDARLPDQSAPLSSASYPGKTCVRSCLFLLWR